MTDPRSAKRAAFEPAERLLRPTGYNPGMKRPASTVAGAALVLLRVGVGIAWLAEAALNRERIIAEGAAAGSRVTSAAALLVVAVIIVVLVIVDLVFAILIYRGHNWPRVIVMVISVISISSTFFAWWTEDLKITVVTSLPSTAVDVLVLLALSSRSASAYARRNEKR